MAALTERARSGAVLIEPEAPLDAAQATPTLPMSGGSLTLAAGRHPRLDAALAAEVVTSLPLGVLVEDVAGACWINDELRRLWGRDDPTPVRPGELEAALRANTRRRSDGQAWGRRIIDGDREARWRSHLLHRPDGTLIPVRVWKRAVAGPLARGVATYVIEDDPRDLDENLRQAFLAMVGHELRSPITSVVAGAELLHATDLDPDTRDEVAALLVEEANRVSLLVEQLTTLTLLQAAGSSLAADPIHLVHLARKVGAREAAGRSGLDLRLPRLASSAAVVLGDEGFIAQVLTILIDNAAKYAGRKATVEIAIRPAADEVCVHVLDRGSGLGGVEPERLFELFRRGPSDTVGSGGFGIGLYVAKQIVTAMHGRIWARDREGGGADFGFALPAAVATPEDAV